MEYWADSLAVIGALLIVVGVFFQFGMGWALIIAGIAVGAFGINLARIINVADSTTETRK